MMRSPSGRVIALLALLSSGCASQALRPDSNPALVAAIRARGVPPGSIVVPFAIDDEMREWARRRIPPGGDVRTRIDLLARALVRSDGLQLEYDPDETSTAMEAFRSRKANCLAYTNLFVGLGRSIGLGMYFLEVADVERFTQEGDLVVVSSHVTAAHGRGPSRLVLDFTPNTERKSYRQVREISDLTAVALFYSNRGARALRSDDLPAALNWLESAVKVEPGLAAAWINLGVARRRSGDEVAAERAYRRALEIDPQAHSAYQNLAALLRLRGRVQEAEDLLAITARGDDRNPYNHLALGDVSLRHGRLEEAERFYRRALNLDRDNAEAYAALGLLSKQRGKASDAMRWLKRALKHQQVGERVSQLSKTLTP